MEPITPARIPMKGLAILSNASTLLALSAIAGRMVVTNPVDSSVVIINQDTSAAKPPVPSFFSDMPTPTPSTNNSAMLSIRAAPAFTKNSPNSCKDPVTSPPCMVAGHSA